MTAGLLSVVAPIKQAFMPSADGPATTITFPTAAPGYRRIVAAEGDLSGTQPDTIKYLLEITAADGNTSGIARTVKLYTYNVESGTLTYLHTVNGLDQTNQINSGMMYDLCFTINVSGGYYYFHLSGGIYVIGLNNGVIWGYTGNLTIYAAENNGVPIFSVVPDPINLFKFTLFYCNTSGVFSFRKVTVNSTNNTVDWGTATTRPYATNTFPGFAMPDIRPNATPGNWLIGRTVSNGTPGPLIFNPNTDTFQDLIATNRNSTYAPGVTLIMGNELLFGGFGNSNMTFYKYNPSISATETSLPSWGTSGVFTVFFLNPYHDFDGKFGKYLMFADYNMDVWITRLAWTNLGVGCFGTALFRASNIVPTMTRGSYNNNVIPCKYGFFYTGQMNTTTTAAPVIWYPLKPNI